VRSQISDTNPSPRRAVSATFSYFRPPKAYTAGSIVDFVWGLGFCINLTFASFRDFVIYFTTTIVIVTIILYRFCVKDALFCDALNYTSHARVCVCISIRIRISIANLFDLILNIRVFALVCVVWILYVQLGMREKWVRIRKRERDICNYILFFVKIFYFCNGKC